MAGEEDPKWTLIRETMFCVTVLSAPTINGDCSSEKVGHSEAASLGMARRKGQTVGHIDVCVWYLNKVSKSMSLPSYLLAPLPRP